MKKPTVTNPPAADILLTQRFLPEPGGSIRWMYEVYRRWPTPVDVITHDYYNHPPHTPEFPEVPPPPDGIDHVTDPQLRMDRRDIFINDWGMEDPRRLLRYARMTQAVRERLIHPANKGRTIRVHCVHAVPEAVSLLPLRWRYGRRIQIISYAHGEEVTACQSSRQLRFLMHRANAAVDMMLVNSQYTKDVVSDHIDPKQVCVVHPGVQLSEFQASRDLGQTWRKEQGYQDKLLVLTVGRLDPRKNHRAIIEAVADLKEKYPNLVYIIAGQGREMDNLRSLAEQRGVAPQVVFAGAVDGATKLAMFGCCDVFAMPAVQDGTDVEGFGMVFMEAAACGKPVIAGRTGGQSEAVLDGETGFVVDGNDGRAVTSTLHRLLSDAGLRETLGTAALQRAESFDWAKVVQRTVELVELMNGPDRDSRA